MAEVITVTLYPEFKEITVFQILETLKMFLFSIFSDYEAFKEAAEQFQPYIKFFATFDKSVSHHQTDRWTDGRTGPSIIEPCSDVLPAAAGGQRADPEVERSRLL